MVNSGTPLFLIGAPRSGTTILCKLLNAHPKVLLTNETAVFLQLNEMIQKSRIGVRAGILFGKAYHELWSRLLEEESSRLIDAFYQRIAKEEGRNELAYWGEKHPHLNNCLPMLSRLYPEARYIYAIRDPRDSACSISEMNNVPVRKALETWNRFSQGYETFVGELPPERCSLVRYEDMIQDYRGTVERLLEELGLEHDDQVFTFLEANKNRDSHQGGFSRASVDFLDKSYMRWKRDLAEEDRSFALEICSEPMRKYGYGASGVLALPETTRVRFTPRVPQVQLPEVLSYHCNICGASNETPVSEIDRERRSCVSCGSSVRTRAVVHLLSLALYGESRELSGFTPDVGIRGIGLSDWPVYARALEKAFTYRNTYFHREPAFDITHPEGSDYRDLDFVISTEVFEHVVQPVQKAFDGAYAVLKPGGSLILTVPYMNRIEETVEHFPELHDYQVRKVGRDGWELTNTTIDGRQQKFSDLRFHGGPGETLEMRIFSRAALLRHLEDAGFSEVRIMGENELEFGIVWKTNFSLPILARK